jgi:NCS1 family nucleobase:cation symporter-1
MAANSPRSGPSSLGVDKGSGLRAGPMLAIERRSIDVVPDRERHGKPFNQFTLWLGANLQITGIVTGALAYILGADVMGAIIGLLVGNLAGGVVMALHSAQGPRLGLPQMISSRAQFGVFGAAIPLVCSVMLYCGYAASSSVLAGQAVSEIAHIGSDAGIIVFALICGVLAVVGYRVIHSLGKIATVVGVLAFIYLSFELVSKVNVSDIFSFGGTTVPEFLVAMSLSAGYQLGYGPYVADYSRYLPREAAGRPTFWATYAGSVIGCQWAMAFGVFAAAAGGAAFAGSPVGYVANLAPAGAMATLILLVIVFGKLTINVLNTYGGFMSVVTIITGFKGQHRITPLTRLAYVLAIVIASTIIALFGRENFLPNYSTFLGFLLTVFTPWSAINLVDYYLVAREKYDIPALTDPSGRYGRWGWQALVAFTLGILAQIPFLATSLVTGPFVDLLGGADISWILGLVLTGILYWVLAKVTPSKVPDRLILPAEVIPPESNPAVAPV